MGFLHFFVFLTRVHTGVQQQRRCFGSFDGDKNIATKDTIFLKAKQRLFKLAYQVG